MAYRDCGWWVSLSQEPKCVRKCIHHSPVDNACWKGAVVFSLWQAHINWAFVRSTNFVNNVSDKKVSNFQFLTGSRVRPCVQDGLRQQCCPISAVARISLPIEQQCSDAIVVFEDMVQIFFWHSILLSQWNWNSDSKLIFQVDWERFLLWFCCFSYAFCSAKRISTVPRVSVGVRSFSCVFPWCCSEESSLVLLICCFSVSTPPGSFCSSHKRLAFDRSFQFFCDNIRDNNNNNVHLRSCLIKFWTWFPAVVFLRQSENVLEHLCGEHLIIQNNSYFDYYSTTAVNLNYGTDPITRYCKCLNIKDTEPQCDHEQFGAKERQEVRQGGSGRKWASLFKSGTFHNSKSRSCFFWVAFFEPC